MTIIKTVTDKISKDKHLVTLGDLLAVSKVEEENFS